MARWVFYLLVIRGLCPALKDPLSLSQARRWRSGKRAGLQNLYSRVQFPPGAPSSVKTPDRFGEDTCRINQPLLEKLRCSTSTPLLSHWPWPCLFASISFHLLSGDFSLWLISIAINVASFRQRSPN